MNITPYATELDLNNFNIETVDIKKRELVDTLVIRAFGADEESAYYYICPYCEELKILSELPGGFDVAVEGGGSSYPVCDCTYRGLSMSIRDIHTNGQELEGLALSVTNLISLSETVKTKNYEIDGVLLMKL